MSAPNRSAAEPGLLLLLLLLPLFTPEPCAIRGAEKLCQWAHCGWRLGLYLLKLTKWKPLAARSMITSSAVWNNNKTVSRRCIKISQCLSPPHTLLCAWGCAHSHTQETRVPSHSSTVLAQKWGPVEIMLSFNFKVINIKDQTLQNKLPEGVCVHNRVLVLCVCGPLAVCGSRSLRCVMHRWIKS